MFKRLITSKTFWTGTVAIASGAGMCAAQDYPQGIQLILGGLLAIFIRDGSAKAEAAAKDSK